MTSKIDLPGQLGNPGLTLASDPRADQRIVHALEPLGMAGRGEPVPLNADSSIDDIRDFATAAEPGFEAVFDVLFADLPPVQGVATSTEVITGTDGNDIPLYVHYPQDAEGPLPGILQLHGGGMVILSARTANSWRWCGELAALGLVVIGVEFRNAAGTLGCHPFPAALNDCLSALKWVNDHRSELGISKILVSGESGGGNLSLATALKARDESLLHMIDGVYAQCPYISGAYGNPPASLPSLHENEGYFLASDLMQYFVKAYDPSGTNHSNRLAWPWHAEVSDLIGMPPHVISVNELDPLRDEGLDYYRKLKQAKVPGYSRTVNGTCHAGDQLLPGAIPDINAASLRDLASFAHIC